MLRWNGAAPSVRIFDTAAESDLRNYLRIALSKPPCRIRRKARDTSGKIELIAEDVIPSDSDFAGRLAAQLTFNPRNEHDFIFTAAGREDARLAARSSQSAVASDLFDLNGTFRSSLVLCPCGTQYPFLTVKCPNCGGFDPFGVLWEKHGSAILQHLSRGIHERLASNSSLCRSLRTVQKSFGDAVAAKANSAGTPLETDDRATASRKILSYYESVFRRGCLTEEIIGVLKSAPSRECSEVIHSLRNSARAMRGLWRQGNVESWDPSESFTTKCHAAIVDSARPALRATGKTAKDMVKVAAQFGPFHAEFKRRVAATEDDLGNFLKGVWRAVKAVKTMGVSEVFRATIETMKDNRFRERFDRFSLAFDKSVASCAGTQKVIDQALRSYDQVLSKIAQGMFFHLMALLAEDYAASDQIGQERMAACIAKIGHCPPSPPRPLYCRGLDAQRRRRIIFACCIGGGIILLFGIVTLIVMLMK
jgi:hypothetical protein